MKNLLQKLYRYDQWRQQQLFQGLEKKQNLNEFINKDYKLFFSNVRGTLIHILCADIIWQGRIFQLKEFQIQNKTIDLKWLISLWKSDDPNVFHQVDFKYEEIRNSLFQMNNTFQDLLDKKTDEELQEQIIYQDSKGQDQSKPLQDILYHLMNHHTHHIGQITNAFTIEYGREDLH
ncbi:hypothetical protein pb186bvf_019399 [Paramecium bursaria]